MKLKITSIIIALASSSFGASVTLSSFAETYNGQDDYGIVLSSGTPVASGSGLASVIVFTSLTDLQVASLAAAQDYATLFSPANFVTVTSDNFTGINTAYGPTAGFVSAGISGFAPNVGKTLYAYFTDGSELGLFKSNLVFAADAAPPALESVYNVRLDTASGTPIIGAYGPDYAAPTYVGGPGTTVNSFQLVSVVPEPSAALLGAIGVLGLLRRRRA